MGDLIGFLVFIATLIFVTFVFPIVILPLFSVENLNKVYEFFSPPEHPKGEIITIVNFIEHKIIDYESLDTKFGKTEYLNLDTGEVKWQDRFEEF